MKKNNISTILLVVLPLIFLSLFLRGNLIPTNTQSDLQQKVNQQKEAIATIQVGDTLKGEIVGIMDGDTYDLLTNEKKTYRIRMEGIDAPERGMPYNKVAKDYLSELCIQKNVTAVVVSKDIYNRLVAYTFLDDGRELSHEMLKAGFAWHYKYYNSDKEMAQLENKARKEKKGLWADENPIAPWEARKMRREQNQNNK